VNKHSTQNECTDSADPFFIAGLDIENIKSGNKGGPKRKKKRMVLPRGCEWATPANCAAYPEVTKNCPASCGFCTNGGVGLLSTQNGRIDSAEQFFIAALGDERGCEWASPEHCKTYPEVRENCSANCGLEYTCTDVGNWTTPGESIWNGTKFVRKTCSDLQKLITNPDEYDTFCVEFLGLEYHSLEGNTHGDIGTDLDPALILIYNHLLPRKPNSSRQKRRQKRVDLLFPS